MCASTLLPPSQKYKLLPPALRAKKAWVLLKAGDPRPVCRQPVMDPFTCEAYDRKQFPPNRRINLPQLLATLQQQPAIAETHYPAFVCQGTGITCVTIQHYKDNPAAASIMAVLMPIAYTEQSYTGGNLHCFVKGSLPCWLFIKDDVEISQSNRPIPVTGRRVGDVNAMAEPEVGTVVLERIHHYLTQGTYRNIGTCIVDFVRNCSTRKPNQLNPNNHQQ